MALTRPKDRLRSELAVFPYVESAVEIVHGRYTNKTYCCIFLVSVFSYFLEVCVVDQNVLTHDFTHSVELETWCQETKLYPSTQNDPIFNGQSRLSNILVLLFLLPYLFQLYLLSLSHRDKHDCLNR